YSSVLSLLSSCTSSSSPRLHSLSLHDALPISTVDNRYFACKTGQIHPFFNGRVTTTNNDEFTVFEECTVTNCTVRNTFTGHFFLDRKSTRLNSSHVSISYAVFCLKKKNNRLII